MGNIDEKRLSALLERIDNIKAELEALENEVRGLGEVTEPALLATEPISPVTEPVEVTATVDRQDSPTSEATVPTETSSVPTDDTPIEIDIPEMDIPPIVEDPAAEYAVASTAEPAAEIEKPVAEPVEVTTETGTPAAEQPVEATAAATVLSESQTMDDLPFGDDLPIEAEEEPLFKADDAGQPQKPRKAIVDSAKAETAVMDVMADNQAWRTDRPGSQVKNVISAISLNDRVLLINVLFKEDPLLFQSTISAFNAMTTLDEAVSYIQTNFPEWDLNSEPVYRLMMAVRRKLR